MKKTAAIVALVIVALAELRYGTWAHVIRKAGAARKRSDKGTGANSDLLSRVYVLENGVKSRKFEELLPQNKWLSDCFQVGPFSQFDKRAFDAFVSFALIPTN